MAAIGHTRHGNNIAQQHRKKATSIAGRLAGFVMGSSTSSGNGFIKSMTPVERHAELVYAESLFEKVRPAAFAMFCQICIYHRPFWVLSTPGTG